MNCRNNSIVFSPEMGRKKLNFRTPKKVTKVREIEEYDGKENRTQVEYRDDSRAQVEFKNADEYIRSVRKSRGKRVKEEESVIELGLGEEVEEGNLGEKSDRNQWESVGKKKRGRPKKVEKEEEGESKKRKNRKKTGVEIVADNSYELCANCKKLEVVQSGLVEALQAENEQLRQIQAGRGSDDNLYKKMLGIDIKQENGRNLWTVQRNGTSGVIRLVFELKDADSETYSVQLVDSTNCSIPEYMYGGIEFEKRSFMLFFYKIMQFICEKKVLK
ncbi:hypothetical protein ECANGB1_1017 [Enterospora canceri]|uniref:DUF5094 domain-containing protein n=1 Tax=Enterospora canceri TaxID=1081671 RepID=A0A1Y1S846_9MICR|nr:hypothetical protein ECANGB1_1017 [Enterospora canceri]